jgi:hypothetical protein
VKKISQVAQKCIYILVYYLSLLFSTPAYAVGNM